MSGLLQLDRLCVSHAGQMLVQLTQDIAPGEVLTIMGPSGAGKSTALAAILGTLPPGFQMTGSVRLMGRDITLMPPHLRRVGLLFQDDVLFPHLSVGGNLAFGIPPQVPKGERGQRVTAALDAAGLQGFANRDPATLSGGQRARVALMRTLLAKPCALLLDEPFSRLDAGLRDQIRGFVLERVRSEQLPAILVTHDAEDARAAGGRVISPLGQPL